MKKIPLTQGKVALVDDTDFEYLNQWKWCVVKAGNMVYAVRGYRVNGKTKQIKMHRLLLDLTDSKILCDHKDHNGLNNQRHNIRIASKLQNNANKVSKKNSTSKYLGVHWCTAMNKWCVQVAKNKKTKHIGYYNCETEAAKAYNKAAIKIHGEYANLNIV